MEDDDDDDGILALVVAPFLAILDSVAATVAAPPAPTAPTALSRDNVGGDCNSAAR